MKSICRAVYKQSTEKNHLRRKCLKYGNNGAKDKPILKVGETFCFCRALLALSTVLFINMATVIGPTPANIRQILA